MAITNERLEELKYNTIYSTFGGVSAIYLDDDTFLKADKLYEKDRKYGDLFVGNLNNLYETKEDAEFVQKFHTSKTIKFEPPTWEEFLRTETDKLKPNYTCENLVIVEDYNEIIVEDYNNDLNEKHFSYNKELNNRKQKYYEAVEYAKKLFLGEEE